MKNIVSQSSHSSSRKAGFTVVELLVAITIVTVLATLAFAVSRRAIFGADRATCVNIMRQYGTAMTGYLGDNNNRMPHVEVNLQKPNYRNEGDWHIFAKLYPYFGLERQSKVTALPENLVCPSFRKRFPNWNADGTGSVAGNVCFMNQDQSINGRRIYGTQRSHKDQYGPMSYASLVKGTDETPLSSILFLSDGHHPTEQDDPVHGKMRNHLFLDFHVESLPAGQVVSGVSP